MSQNIEKELHSNKNRLLHKMLRESGRYGWIEDYDQESGEVIFSSYDEDDIYRTYKVAVSFDAGFTKATMSGDPVEVVGKDSYVEVSKDSSDETITKSWLEEFLTKHFGGSSKEDEKSVIKQFDDVKHTTTEFLYVAPMEVDGIGDTYPVEDLEPMINSFNKAIEDGRLQSGLFHKHRTEQFRVTKAWAAEEDCTMGEFEIKKGQPLVEIEYLSERLFELRKSGEVMGPSIGARCKEIIEVDENGVEKSLGEGEVVIGKGNPLDQIKGERKVKRILKGINFDWDNPELTLTDPSAGGACSLKNEIIIEKSMQPLNETQKSILDEIEEEFTPIAKQLNEESEEVDNTGVNENDKETDMSVEKDQEIAELKKQLRKVDVEKAFAKYELEDSAELIDLAAGMEDFSVITKALDAMEAKAAVAIEKAKTEVTPENPVEKALSEEQGEGGEPEQPVQKSLQEQMKEILEKGTK